MGSKLCGRGGGGVGKVDCKLLYLSKSFSGAVEVNEPRLDPGDVFPVRELRFKKLRS